MLDHLAGPDDVEARVGDLPVAFVRRSAACEVPGCAARARRSGSSATSTASTSAPAPGQLRREPSLAAAEVEHARARLHPAQQEAQPQREVLGLEPGGDLPPELFVVGARRHRRGEPRRRSGARAARNVWTEREPGTAHSCREAVRAIYARSQRLCWRCEGWGARAEHQRVRPGSMKVALDSRPAVDRDGVGRYARCLLQGPSRDRRGERRGARHEPSLASAARPRHRRLPHALDRRARCCTAPARWSSRSTT